ncbi:MAG: cytochrome c oxidase accessory protein CcoG [Phyllobacteriaceae bacterium]|nr:cytochrome c oxidase accessory protein CcoG [Phyllobacteriaceae bacterium]
MSVDAAGGQGGKLYADHKKIYPIAVSGFFRRLKWAILIVGMAIYYLLPFVRWDRGPGQPDQAVLLDLPARRFYFFFIEIWPQEVYYVTGLLIVSAFVLFLMNALAGRVWCGYLCPQTVWTDLYLAVERLVEGADRRSRQKLDDAPWSLAKLARKAAKHALWILIAWGTGGAWVLYFADAPTLVKDLATFQAPAVAYMWIGALTFSTYLLAGFAREQVCIYMCPWPRIQAALTDEWAYNVSYRVDRGEPRGSLKTNRKLRAEGQPAGDCVDCGQCVAVCPTGTDIRKGMQLSCIQCGLCIDACDTVMAKTGQAPRLIAYDNDINIERREKGLADVHKFVRPRTILYVVLIAGICGLMAWKLGTRATIGLNVLHDRNPLYVLNSDGSVRNGYTLRLLNKDAKARELMLSVSGVPADSRLETVSEAGHDGSALILKVDGDQTREIRVILTVPAENKVAASQDVVFRLSSSDGEKVHTQDFFKAP